MVLAEEEHLAMNAKILIAEDELRAARDLEYLLKTLGYGVAGVAASGEEAVRAADRNNPDLVLINICLQGPLDGVDAAAEIRKRWFLPVVYLTPETDEATIQRARLTEPLGYLMKPVEERELKIVVDLALYRHQVERRLRESEARFHAFMDNSPVVAFLKDELGRYVYANRPCQKLFTGPVREWRGKTDFDLWPRESAELFLRSDQQALASDQPIQLQETDRSPEGRARHWLTYKFQLRDAQGQRLVGGMALDITRQKEMEEQLYQAQKMESIGRLAGGIAHDFNNLLTAINGNASLLLRSMPEDHPWYQSVMDILRAGERAADLTAQLLAFGRKQMVQPRATDLNRIVTGITKTLSRLLGDTIELVTDLQPGLGPVRADPGQLEQALLNLAVNARDAMPEGGKLIIATADVVLGEMETGKVSEIAPGPYRRLTVTDTGHGIPEEFRPRVFEPFFTTKDVGQGIGLGLATVYAIVRQCQGHIVMESEVGKGTRFTIYFPPAPVEAPAINKPSLGGNPLPTGTETVLLVEDEDSVRDLVRRVLQMCGYLVLEARHGAEALELSGRYSGPIHLLLTDMAMPQMDGRELKGRLFSQRPELKVLYISGYGREHFEEGPLLGDDEPFLEKPFSPAVLAVKVREVLDRKPPAKS